MPRARPIAIAALAAVTFGPLALTAGYAWYLRSGWYRNSCAARLAARLGLPSEIGRVVPRARLAREFQAVRVWLPGRRGVAASCERAVLTCTPTAADPAAYQLDLSGGRCEISTRTWLGSDYRFVLEAGLRPGFARGGPRRVAFSGMDLTFERDQFRAALNNARGLVRFDDPQTGCATVTCDQFNGHVAGAPVALYAAFSPQNSGIRLDRVQIDVPELPVATVGLSGLAGLDLRTGTFAGRLTYEESDAGRRVSISGSARDLQLAECTAGLATRPWRGAASAIELEELTLVNDVVQRIRFRGALTDVVLGDILAPWGLEAVGGRCTLRVNDAELSPAGVDHFSATGAGDGFSVERLSEAVGWGRVTGEARVEIDDLTIRQNRLASLDARIVVKEPAGEPNWFERGLLSQVLKRAAGLTVPKLLLDQLPERIEYQQLGVRLQVRDEVLYVFGTHGPREKAILSVSLGGQELPVLLEPEDSFDLGPYLADLRTRLATRLQQRLPAFTPVDAWQALQSQLHPAAAPPSAPAQRTERE